jgi:hypothetical protein
MKSYLSIGLLVLATLLSTLVFAAAPAENITRIALTVAGGNDEWSTTNLKVAPGDILLIKASGTVTVGSYLGKTGPDGANGGVGQLQLKIGASAVHPVGSVRYITVTEAGTAKLRVYDTKYQDNSGEYAVEVIRIPVSLIPEAQQVVAQ